MNTGLTKFLNFSSRKKLKSRGLIINGVSIQEVEEMKLLRSQLSKTLNLDKHIQKMRSKLNSCLYHMKVPKKSVKIKKLQNLYYNFFIFPNLTYCSSLFYYSLRSSQKQTQFPTEESYPVATSMSGPLYLQFYAPSTHCHSIYAISISIM